jgi:hypothetical protein
MEDMQAAFARVAGLAQALGLAGIEQASSYGTPALKVGGKLLVRLKDTETLVLSCPVQAKELLIEVAPEIYFQTEHYASSPAVLVRLAAIDDEELSLRLGDAWAYRAPARLKAASPRSGSQ